MRAVRGLSPEALCPQNKVAPGSLGPSHRGSRHVRFGASHGGRLDTWGNVSKAPGFQVCPMEFRVVGSVAVTGG